MSVENNKVCCNCRHCSRRQDGRYDMVVCRCEINKIYLSYAEVMCGWCKEWKKKEGE